MVQCPVCSSAVNEAVSMLKVEKDAKTHYFCSNTCMKRFKSDSQKYLKPVVAAPKA